MRKVLAVIHQSNLFPRIKVLTKIAMSDIYLTQNDVQFVRREWQNRFRIHSGRGDLLVSVPVHLPNGRATRICDVQIINPASSFRVLRETVRHTYRRATYWRDVADYVEEVAGFAEQVAQPSNSYLVDFASRSVAAALARIAPHVLVSDWRRYEQPDMLTPSERLAEAAQKVGATAYLAGSGGRNYMDTEAFAQKGIRVLWQDWAEDATALGLGTDTRAGGNLSIIHYISEVGIDGLRSRMNALRADRRRQWGLEA